MCDSEVDMCRSPEIVRDLGSGERPAVAADLLTRKAGSTIGDGGVADHDATIGPASATTGPQVRTPSGAASHAVVRNTVVRVEYRVAAGSPVGLFGLLPVCDRAP